MIDLGEGISGAKILLVEVQGGLGDSKHKLGTKELNHRLTYEDTLGHIHGVIVLKDLVGTSADGVQVGGDPRGLGELSDCDVRLVFVELEEPLNSSAFQDVSAAVFSVTELKACLPLVTDGAPFSGAASDEGHLGLHVWLIETGEHSEAMECLELRVKVLLLI